MKKSVLFFSVVLLAVSMLLAGCGKESKFNDCYSKLNKVVSEYEQYAETTLKTDAKEPVEKKMDECKSRVNAIYKEMEEIIKDDQELAKRYQAMKNPFNPDPLVKRASKVYMVMMNRLNEIFVKSLNTTSTVKLTETSPFAKYGKLTWSKE